MEMKEEKYYLKPNLKNFLIENGAYEEFIERSVKPTGLCIRKNNITLSTDLCLN